MLIFAPIFIECTPKIICILDMEERKSKRIPHGMMNFVVVHEDEIYYVYKTLRKCLTMSMIRHYNNINANGGCDETFSR